MSDTLLSKLLNIQCELKAPKSQKNTFGKFNYRSCEDILEAVKPLCMKHEVSLRITDELIQIGERYYVKAIAVLYDTKSTENTSINTHAYAREPESQKGMSDGQCSGATSSYARKYALSGLFLLDDSKTDIDSVNNEPKPESDKQKKYKDFEFLNHAKKAKEVIGEQAYYEVLGIMGYEKSNEIPPDKREEALTGWRQKVLEQKSGGDK